MPFLGRLFARKNKVSPRAEIFEDDISHSPTFAPTTTESNDSSHSSYVTPDISVPSHPDAQKLFYRGRGPGPASATTHPTPATGGGGGLRLFRRKKSTTEFVASSALDVNSWDEFISQRPVLLARPSDAGTDPTEFRRLRPPPSRSAIFAAYADSGSSISTRSLPENSLRPSSPVSSSTTPSQKRPSLFAWAKSASRSSSNTGSNVDVSLRAPSESSELSPDVHSFNLKSFRHVGSAPPPPPPLPNQRLSPPIPRQRGTSLYSDPSQRISVAAFREVQARRSHTGSPVPSPPESSFSSTLPASSPATAEGPRPGRRPRPSRSSTALLQTSRPSRSSIAVVSTDDDDSSEAGSEAESVYKTKYNQRPGRKAQSELGHGSMITESSFQRASALVRTPRASRSHVGHGILIKPRPLTEFESDFKIPELPRRPQSSYGVYENPNTLAASASTTSLSKSVAERKRNLSNSSNVTHSTARKIPLPQTTSNQKSTMGKDTVGPPPRNSDSDSDDNAPLASLIAPKRPGSAASSYSHPRSISGQTNRSTGPPKPLIDVNEVISSKPTSISSPLSDAAFTQGPTLLSSVKTTTGFAHGSSPLVPNAKLADDSSQPLERKISPGKFVTPPSSPAKEMRELMSPSLEERVNFEKSSEVSTYAPISQQGEVSAEEQKRDPLSDRLTRAVKKNLTNPTNSVSTLALTINKPPEVPTNRLSVATSSESLSARQSYDSARIALPRSPPPIIHPSKNEYSPPDEDLAKLLGSAGIKLISRTGDSDETSSSESDEEVEEEEEEEKDDRIAPIVIKERTPPPAFAVTSRPAFPKQQDQEQAQSPKSSPPEAKNLPAQVERETLANTRPSEHSSVRQRSSSMLPSSSASSFPSTTASPSTRNSKGTSYLTSPSATDVSTKGTSSDGHTGVSPMGVNITTNVRPALGVRPKSHTMITGVPLASQMPRHAPDRRFATVRRNSPSSSTGDSSSGRAPHTPRDSGEVRVTEDRDQKRLSTMKTEEWSRGTSGLVIKRQNAHTKRRSVSFEDDVRSLNTKPSRSHIREAATAGPDTIGSGGGHVREGARAGPDRDSVSERERGKEKEKEEKRKERRRQETQAAIELGNVMHGPPPVLDDDNTDMPSIPTMNRPLSGFNPMMVVNSMNTPMNFSPPGPGGWVPSMGQPMLSPSQFMIPQPSNPTMMAAHQQAMMFAKQAYQMAVAQQAMAAAAEEWERGSGISGFGSGGSVYGNTGPSMMNSSSGMMAGMNMMSGMQGDQAGAMWPGYGGMGTVPRFGNFLTPSDMRFDSSRSDHGGSGAGNRASGTWTSSRSMYGESQHLNESFSRKAALQQQFIKQQWNTGRDSMHVPPVPPMPPMPLVSPIPTSKNTTGRGSPDLRGSSRLRTASQPTTPTRSAFSRKAIPPSSWRPAGS